MIISIEGHSYTGKSTLAARLSHFDNVTVIPETDVYAGGIENYPPFPSLTRQMAANNVDFFARLEEKRIHDASTSPTDTIVIDRSFLSVALFQKFIEQLENEWVGVPDYAKTVYSQRVDDDQVIVPDVMVLTQCASDEEYTSRLSREISVSALQTTEAYRFFTDEYLRLFEVYKKLGRLLLVVNENGSNLESLSTDIIEFSNQAALSREEKKNIAHTMIEEI